MNVFFEVFFDEYLVTNVSFDYYVDTMVDTPVQLRRRNVDIRMNLHDYSNPVKETICLMDVPVNWR